MAGLSICSELIVALERARTRLAVAVAAGAKRRTARGWEEYLKTEDGLRRQLKRLRSGPSLGRAEAVACVRALQQLRRLPSAGDTAATESDSAQLCRHLCSVLAQLAPVRESPRVERRPHRSSFP